MPKGHGKDCPYCGVKMTRKAKYRNTARYATTDHITPRCDGGTETLMCCLGCNNDKGHLTINEWRMALCVRYQHIHFFYFEKRIFGLLLRLSALHLSQWLPTC